MAEYIERERLRERFRKRIKWLEKDVHDQYSLGLFHGCEYDADLINEIPTIDAVPVVRCKDCKHYWKNKNTPGYSDKCVTVSDDFCSYGERKEVEKDG